MQKRTAFLPLNFLVFVLILSASGCTAPEEERESEVVRPVKMIKVQDIQEPVTRVFPGRVRPYREARLSFRVANELKALEVDKGDYVQKGQVVARLDPRDFRLAEKNLEGRLGEARSNLEAMQSGARVEDVIALEAELRAAQSALKENRLQYTRYKELYRQGAAARAELDKAETALEQARGRKSHLAMELQKALLGARQEDIEAMQSRIESMEASLEEARSSLKDSVLRAPFSGYIAQKHVDSHENVSAGQPIATLQDLSQLEVDFSLPEQVLVQQQSITTISCVLDSFPGFPLPAHLKEISTEAVDFSYAATARLAVPDDITVFPSMSANVHISLKPTSENEKPVVLLPETAFFTSDGRSDMVWIYDPGTSSVQARDVRTGEMTSSGVQVLSGVAPGELVITAGADFIEEGQRVRPLE